MIGSYPGTKTEACSFCGAEVHLTRRGDGKLWRGRPNFWYTADHRCPKLAGAAELNDRMQNALLRRR